jgi:iron complex transport system substrate-binding protein
MGLSQLQKLGVGFVVPKVDPAKPTWESVSWELADKYPADVILYDGRNTEPYLTDAARYPTFARLPAVRAKQVFAFNPETPPSWAQFAPVFRQFTTNLGTVRPVTG